MVETKSRSASAMIGSEVKNMTGEKLGKIEDLILDLDSGRIAYAVLSFGGFLHIGNKLFAIPPKVLNFHADKGEFLVNVDKSVLKNAPGFEKDDWPDVADRAYATKIYSYYGYTPYWE
ncbi:MAG: PRC-barrel domain-containing protein [Thermoanaerobaculia bacterium]